jgi:hypothetical protein
VVADAGYSDLADIDKIEKAIDVVVPLQRKTDEQDGFIYDKENNTYTCLEGHTLIQYTVEFERKRTRYKLSDPVICQNCVRFGTCTKSIYGRNVSRSFFEESSQRMIANFTRPEIQKIYKQRTQKVELPFGHMRRTMGIRSFLVRGLNGVKAEMSLFSSAFNIRRMITLFGGVQSFIAAVSA